MSSNLFTAPEGKEFDGWSLSQNGEKITGTINVTEDITLFARWKDIEPEFQPEEKNGLSVGIIIVIISSLIVVSVGVFALIWFGIKKRTLTDFLTLFKRK